jgi:hypothetical protein
MSLETMQLWLAEYPALASFLQTLGAVLLIVLFVMLAWLLAWKTILSNIRFFQEIFGNQVCILL